MKIATLLIAIVLGEAAFAPALRAQESRADIEAIVRDYLAANPDEVGGIVKDYFIKHPEAVGQILAELLKHRPSAGTAAAKPAAAPSAAVAENAAAIFASPHQVALGDPNGNVTLVEFFDYNCGFCKRALPDMLALIRDDPHLKVVLKEFPILGPGSAEAARVAVAVRMQDNGGEKYLAFHRALLGGPGPASEEKALAVAQDQGLDMDKLTRDMASDEVAATLSEDTRLAAALSFTGTPSYVVGKEAVMGAVGLTALKARIAKARAESAARASDGGG
jgi:protein-disulfide isomerase